jgi:hypothetical protein
MHTHTRLNEAALVDMSWRLRDRMQRGALRGYEGQVQNLEMRCCTPVLYNCNVDGCSASGLEEEGRGSHRSRGSERDKGRLLGDEGEWG